MHLTILLLFCLSSLQVFTSTVDALKVSVSVPELVKLNDAFWLNCTHQKQQLQHHQPNSDQPENSGANDEIYAIKWYKDDEEFYRYLPNAQPKVSIYETNGIQLDQTKSYEGSVFVNKADVNSEGNYRCEILSEAPLFETVRKSKHLKVYALPVRGPRIEILDSNGRPKSPKAQEISYAVGDKIELRCNSAPSKPSAKLRWYLNDRELTIPTSNSSSASLTNREKRSGSSTQSLAHNVRVTPIEYRQHYKSIYSSHSTLSLVLQQDDLINNKISFKCLASMRQDVPLKSKQLILLTPQATASQSSFPSSSSYQDSSSPEDTNAEHQHSLRSTRSLFSPIASSSSSSDLIRDNEAHVHHRQRPQHHRHSISRLTHQQQSRSQQQPKLSGDLINNLPEDALKSQIQMLYIFEDSDSTFGSSIIDSAENLENYMAIISNSLRRAANESVSENVIYNSNSANYIPEFNRADNLEYLQLLRERVSRQRSFPAQQTSSSSHNLKRIHGTNTLVKSPLYLDELDTLRPIISWPPLESGRLMLLPPGQTIVAIPTYSSTMKRANSAPEQQHHKYILPARVDSELTSNSKLPIQIEDGSVDTKLSWVINDLPLDVRDTRLYPTKVSPDHRQTWLTIGLQVASANLWATSDSLSNNKFIQASPISLLASSSPASLQTILEQYLKGSSTMNGKSSTNANGFRTNPSSNTPSQPQSNQMNNQIKFLCQAVHSMLLYSSSEMITFDFNPPPPLNAIDGNSIEKFALPSNVIQATSAPQSSSAAYTLHHISNTLSRSQIILITCLISLIFYNKILISHQHYHPLRKKVL